jgi:hypothetical protein
MWTNPFMIAILAGVGTVTLVFVVELAIVFLWYSRQHRKRKRMRTHTEATGTRATEQREDAMRKLSASTPKDSRRK